jgi:hypothetical protein
MMAGGFMPFFREKLEAAGRVVPKSASGVSP